MSEPRQEPAEIIESCLCKACDELLEMAHSDTIDPFFEKKRGFVAIQKDAADNCPFCLIIYRELFRKLPPNLPRDEYRVSISTDSLEEDFMLQVRCVDDDPDKFCVSIILQFVLLKDNLLRLAQLAASYEYPSKTDAQPVLELIRSWFIGCRNDHAECKHSVHHPPRLLEVLGEKFRLVDSKSSQVEDSYATLSHCWGSPSPSLKLTSENIEVLQQWTPTISLPKTFADAAKLCSFLSIKYLWIDSLCIIQEGKGSAEDWLHHVTEMRVIYSNGTLNIAASHAASSSEGLWTSRNPDFIRPSIIKGSNRYGLSDNQYLLVQCGYNSPGWAYSPLNHRAWVFQERLMSPRVVHFESEQVHWECHSSQMCETYPVGIPHQYFYGNLPSFTLPVTTAPAVSYQHWDAYMDLVEHYSECKITYADTDKFAAFAGIAQHICQEFNDEYAAGIFKKLLPRALLWYISEEFPPHYPSTGHQHPDYSTANSCYRAPSWSWAKTDSPVRFLGGHIRVEVVTSVFLKVQEINARPMESTSPFGRLESAHMIVRGRLLPWISTIRHGTNLFDRRAEACINPEELLLLPVLQRFSSVVSLIVMKLETGPRQCYKRVGLHMIEQEELEIELKNKNQEELMLI